MRCAAVVTAYGTTAACRREAPDLIHARPEPGCAWPLSHHTYTEEPMPEPRVTIGTVLSFFEPDDMDPREAGAKPNVTIQFSRGDRLPRVGDRVAVAGSVDAIFGWMASLPATRVIEAAKAWAADCRANGVVWVSGSPIDRLLKAVEALGEAPSEAYDPGQEAGDRGATVITIIIGEERG